MNVQIATVTQKGQVTIPLSMRNLLGIKPYSKVLLSIDKKSVRLESAPDILDLAGTLVPRKNKGVDPVHAREFMEKNYSR